jgi:hypothetical protein
MEMDGPLSWMRGGIIVINATLVNELRVAPVTFYN